jgi:hypothetical protein
MIGRWSRDGCIPWSTQALSTGVLHQMVFTFDESAITLALYVDGTLRGSNASAVGQLSQIDDRNNWIGRANIDFDYFGGTILEVRIYDTALDAAQVAASYSVGPDP